MSHMKRNTNTPYLFWISLLICPVWIAARIYIAHNATFVFLVWNLFLAFLPYQLSLYLQKNQSASAWRSGIVLLGWLAFFPNTFYIITDLFHLQERKPVPLWFDTGLLFFTAWNGLMLGILSMMKVQDFLEFKFGKRWAEIMVMCFFPISGFGIYIGRYLRWNSWDIVTRPHALAIDILPTIVHPVQHAGVWGMSLAFGLFQALIYFSLKKIYATR